MFEIFGRSLVIISGIGVEMNASLHIARIDYENGFLEFALTNTKW